MDVMLVVDMQVGLREGAPKYDLLGVVGRINALGGAIRKRGGRVLFIQHCGDKGDRFEPGTPGWRFLPELRRAPDDLVVAKTVAPRAIVGKTLEQAAVRRRYGVTIVKVRSADGEWRAAGASSVISAGDLLIVIGPVEATEWFAALR